MILSEVCGGRALGIAVGIIVLELLLAGGAYAVAPISDGFDYPVGIPDGAGWHVAQDFLDTVNYYSTYTGMHLGEDWNLAGGDEGQPVYAIGNGEVIDISYSAGPDGWGRLILIKHKLIPGSDYDYVVSLYGHLGRDPNNPNFVNLAVGDKVARGTKIGYIGANSENGGWPPHLHFEIRTPQAIIDPDCGSDSCHNDGYDSNPIGWLNPTSATSSGNPTTEIGFIDSHRPKITPLIGDWDNNNIDTTGTFDPRTSMFSLDSGGSIQFGEPGDFPIIGDWNGDGIDTIGIYRPKTAEFHIDFNNDQTTDQVINFGEIGDYPIIGDWNNDGTDEIGVFRLLDSNTLRTTFFLKYPDRVEAERIEFGTQSDFPITGDWNNDGNDEIGVFRRFDSDHENNAVFYLRNGGQTINVVYGNNDDIPIVGRWDNDGLTKIGIYRPTAQDPFIFNHNPLIDNGNPTLSVSILVNPNNIISGQNSQITIHVTSGEAPVTDANIEVSTTGGILDPTIGTTDINGDFVATYNAPSVTSQIQYSFSATATKNGYNGASGSDTITVQPNTPTGNTIRVHRTATGQIDVLDIETEYLPYVVAAENGGAPFESMKAQAIASRTFAYYKKEHPRGSNFDLNDDQSDQVYNPDLVLNDNHRRSVSETNGIVLKYNGVIIASFYVSGSGSTTQYLTYNEGKSGDDITQSSIGWVTNPPSLNPYNRGCMGQNQANALANSGYTWQRILRYFYGEDIILESVGNIQRNAEIIEQSISPTIATPGDELTFVFNINNPNQDNIENVRLGAQIRTNDPQGIWIDDPSNDQVATLLSGTHDYSRTFIVPESLSSGFYDVRWVILDHITGNWIDSSTMTRIFEIRSVGRSGGPDDFGYTFKDSNTLGGPSYEWIDIVQTGVKIITNCDDCFVDNVPVGFFFNFYGADYSQVSITNNGLTLASGGTWEYTNRPIGSSIPHNFIAPFWDDIVTWDSIRADAIYYQTIGEAPNRKLVVQWNDNYHYSSSPSGITFEAILYEGSNNIKFQYKDVNFGVSGWDNGASATIGIEGASGRGLQYSYNEGVITPGLAILFKFPAFSGTNMHVSKNAPPSLDHGNTMTYTLNYNNFGSTIASNVVLEDTLPSNVEFVSASDGGAYNAATRKVTWNIGSVPVFPSGRGTRTVIVRIPASVSVGTVIQNTASISTTILETRYDDNSASASTTVTGTNLPQDVGVSPINGISGGTPSIYWGNPITYSYQSCPSSTGVDIRIHINDGGSDITGSMSGGPPGWTYTAAAFYPRHGTATITYTVYGCSESTVSFNIYIDPAGYIYDADTGTRIEGATVWLQRPLESGEWENVPEHALPNPIMNPDENPLTTGADGQYQWDVLAGTYRVHVEAPDYYPANSIVVVIIDEPVTDLHVPLTHLPDSTAPVIANISNTSNTNSAVITWDTNEASDSLVKYGTSSGTYTLSESSSNMVLSHSVSLTGLTSDTLYYYVVNSTDGSHNSAQSSERTFRTQVLSDTTSPVIESVTIYPVNVIAGAIINISVRASDNIGVTEVTANNTPLTNNSGLWQGSITAASVVGTYTVTIRANDSAGNSVEKTETYKVVTPSGSLGVGVAPKTKTASILGTTIDYTIKIKSMQNFDDIVRVNVTMDGFPLSYQMPLGWFDWNDRTVYVASNSTASLPLRLIIPPGQPAGRKAFKVRANSTLWITTAYDSGVITIS